MSEITDFLQSKEEIKGNYELLSVSHPKIEENYGTICIVKVNLDSKDNKPLLIVPGYSNDSFESGFNIVLSGLEHLKKKYSVLYMLCWGSTIKKLSKDYISEEFRGKLAVVLDKIIRSPELDLTNLTILAKSAGAGVCIPVTSMNTEVKSLFIACPAINSYGELLANRKDLPIKLCWNKDDDKISYSESEKFINDFKKQGNKYKFFSYEKGGHEFNEKFILEL